MSLRRVGIRPHPCEPWTSLVPAVGSRLLPGGNDASLPVLRRRLVRLESWKTEREWKPSQTVGLLQRVAAQQGMAVAQALGQILSGVAPVVLTGQQPGFAGGPLFVWLKAHSAIVHAERMSAKLGLPVRALFWVAGDDSDLSEVRYASDPVTGAHVDSHPGIPDGLSSVGDIPFPDPSALRSWSQLWGDGALSGLVENSPDLSSLMIACLHHWFGDKLVIVDARWNETRVLAKRSYRMFAQDPLAVHVALTQGMQGAQASGLKVAIRSWPDKLRLFRLGDDGQRRRIVLEGEYTDGTGWSVGPKALNALLKSETERFSHDVVSRPFAAEEIFPVLAHVLGPGEYAYFACLGTLSESLGQPLAPALPRASCTVLPAGPWPLAQSAGWDPPVRSSGAWDPLKMTWLRDRHSESRLWTKTWADARADYLEQFGPTASNPALAGLGRKLAQFETRLCHSRLLALASQHDDELVALKRLWNLAGAGGLQERLLSPWALEYHIQPGLLRQLAEVVDPDEPVHVVWEAR